MRCRRRQSIRFPNMRVFEHFIRHAGYQHFTHDLLYLRSFSSPDTVPTAILSECERWQTDWPKDRNRPPMGRKRHCHKASNRRKGPSPPIALQTFCTAAAPQRPNRQLKQAAKKCVFFEKTNDKHADRRAALQACCHPRSRGCRRERHASETGSPAYIPPCADTVPAPQGREQGSA